MCKTPLSFPAPGPESKTARGHPSGRVASRKKIETFRMKAMNAYDKSVRWLKQMTSPPSAGARQTEQIQEENFILSWIFWIYTKSSPRAFFAAEMKDLNIGWGA